jgi:hypothetical protein
LLLHDADKHNLSLKVETAQVENLKNVKEMDEFIKGVTTINLPNEFGKHNIISKLSSISSTQNLISDFETLKHEYEILSENYKIIKNQNEMLIKENQNLNFNSKTYSEEVNSLRDQVTVFKLNKNIGSFNK